MLRKRIAMLGVLLLAAALPLLVSPPPARSAEPSLAVLVVGDETGGILTDREKQMFKLLSAWRTRARLTKVDLPIISYHMNKQDERDYCEKGLGIKRGNLLFVGLVEHEKRVPQKVVYRLNNVVDTSAAADKVMAEVVTRLGLDPSILIDTPAATGSPTVAPSVAPSAAPRPKGVTLLKVFSVDHQGNPQSRFLATDRGVYVNAFLHNDNPATDHRHTLSVRLLDPSGQAYGRPMGGAFTVIAGERIDQTDMVRRSDPDRHNGYLIKANALAQKPGRYQIIIEIDGDVAGKSEFEIVPST